MGRNDPPETPTGPSGDFDTPDPDAADTTTEGDVARPTGPSGDFDSDDDS